MVESTVPVLTGGSVAVPEARRELAGLTARLEKKVLLWLAARMPASVNPDHLTGLGLAAMGAGGLFYAGAARQPALLLAVNVALAVNWFGDSLDGTLARHRGRLRPRWGFYADHLVDVVGALLLLGGLAVSGFISVGVAVALLIAYYLVNLEIYLAAQTVGRFKISCGGVGGTEIRILLALANVAAFLWPRVTIGSAAPLLLDLVGMAAVLGLLATFAFNAVVNGAALYERP
jgi:archaetidylinositol phosphate synthase